MTFCYRALRLLLFGRVRLLERIAQLARPYYRKRSRIFQRGFGSVLEQCAQAGNLTHPAGGPECVLSV
jgi:hypothetical protein